MVSKRKLLAAVMLTGAIRVAGHNRRTRERKWL
jgi:hypothetical protein